MKRVESKVTAMGILRLLRDVVFLALSCTGLYCLGAIGYAVAERVGPALMAGAEAPSRVAWLEKTHEAFVEKRATVASQAHMIAQAKTHSERSELMLQLASAKRVCKYLVALYNESAEKSRLGVGAGSGLPEKLRLSECDRHEKQEG